MRPSLDEILAHRSNSMSDGVFYRAMPAPRSFDNEKRSCKFVMTDETPDSYGDIVRASGVILERFNSNPIALLNHNRNNVIGTWSDVKRVSKRVEGVVTLAEEGTADYIDQTAALMRQGIIRAASIGFMPKEWNVMRDDDERFIGIEFLEWELTECSVVSVPANPAALAKSIKQGNTLALQFLEDVLDNYTRTAAGLIVPRSELEDAHKEATWNRKSTLTLSLEQDETMKEFCSLVERAEAAVAKLSGDAPVGEGEGEEAEIILMTKDVEDAVEDALKEFESGVDELPEEKGGVIRSLFDRIRSVFRSEEPEDIKDEPVYVEGSLEEAKALRERMKNLAAEEAA